jgi:hypothetical protein
VLAPERSKSAPHRVDVEGEARMPGEAAQERMGDLASVDKIEVALPQGRAPGVESGGRLGGLEHADRIRQESVQAPA